LRGNVKSLAKGIVYESRANIADHPKTKEDMAGMSNLGM